MTDRPAHITGMTLCSGIGAPEVAAPWVDWRFASEIEPFSRAVLQQRFGYRAPEDHNQGDPLLWGDMTEVTPELLRRRGIPLPDLIVAGTPCQPFSVAGLRKGTADARGNLTLKFVEICHDLAAARPDGRLAVLWENVPGVLSDNGNAFGCFLGGLVGANDAICSPDGGSWPGAGMVSGPRARCAFRVLDAQYFGVAQRRRRVFVVVDFGGALDPAAVLFERKGLRGDTPPSRETGQKIAPTISARTNGGGGLGTDFDCDGGLIASTGDTAHCLNAGAMGRIDFETETMVAHALRGEGFDASEDGTGRGTPIVPVAFDCKGSEVQFTTSGVNPPLRSMGHNDSHQNAGGHAAIAIQEPITIAQRGRDGDPSIETRQDGTTNTILTPSGGRAGLGVGAIAASESDPRALWTVRRLTPTECHRLQGFEDDHCNIPWRGKDHAPDGPQYKVLGNSMAVPCIAWIMDRMKISMGEVK